MSIRASVEKDGIWWTLKVGDRESARLCSRGDAIFLNSVFVENTSIGLQNRRNNRTQSAFRLCSAGKITAGDLQTVAADILVPKCT